MTFRVGQKVVCVDASPADDGGTSMLIRGDVYTVASVLDGWQGVGITLVEIVPRDGRLGWFARRFRPVKTTSIEVFRHMLAPSPKERVRA